MVSSRILLNFIMHSLLSTREIYRRDSCLEKRMSSVNISRDPFWRTLVSFAMSTREEEVIIEACVEIEDDEAAKTSTLPMVSPPNDMDPGVAPGDKSVSSRRGVKLKLLREFHEKLYKVHGEQRFALVFWKEESCAAAAFTFGAISKTC